MAFIIWLVQWATTGLPGGDEHVFRHGLGLWSPAMREHWARFWRERSYHTWKNIWTEWTRLDAERSSKVFVFIIQCLCVAVLALALTGCSVTDAMIADPVGTALGIADEDEIMLHWTFPLPLFDGGKIE